MSSSESSNAIDAKASPAAPGVGHDSVDSSANAQSSVQSSAPSTSTPKTPRERAKWILSTSLRIVGTLLVIFLALQMGRTTLQLWGRLDEPLPNHPIGPSNQLGTGTWRVQFGDQPQQWHRSEFTGNDASAEKQLLAFCLPILAQSPPKPGPPEPSEQQMLDRLSIEKPLKWGLTGQVRLYKLPGRLPMIVGTTDPRKPAETLRVRGWSIMLPRLPEQWTLYVFTSGGKPKTPADTGVARVEQWNPPARPPRGKKTLLVRDPQGRSALHFREEVQTEVGLDEWVQHFKAWFQKHQYQPEGSWRVQHGGQRGTYSRPARPMPGSQLKGEYVETVTVFVTKDRQGRLSALLERWVTATR